jgi:hypothetical protein
MGCAAPQSHRRSRAATDLLAISARPPARRRSARSMIVRKHRASSIAVASSRRASPNRSGFSSSRSTTAVVSLAIRNEPMAAALKTLSAMALSLAIRCSADIAASSSMAAIRSVANPELDPRPHGAPSVNHMMLHRHVEITMPQRTQLRRRRRVPVRRRWVLPLASSRPSIGSLVIDMARNRPWQCQPVRRLPTCGKLGGAMVG